MTTHSHTDEVKVYVAVDGPQGRLVIDGPLILLRQFLATLTDRPEWGVALDGKTMGETSQLEAENRLLRAQESMLASERDHLMAQLRAPR